jgi:NAD(P)-dependent dehydrogenase (short-subunit alcohol dehydrogenase family)
MATLIVTGGGRGIGAATAILAAKRGWSVAINYRGNSERANGVVAEIAKGGGKAIALAGDVADEGVARRLFQTAESELGPIGGLVTSAGVIGPVGRLEGADPKAVKEVMDINIAGTIFCCQEAIRRLSTKHGGKGGAIVLLSSAAARLGGANSFIPYAASKGAIDTLTFGLAQEIAGEGIRINAVRPGIIDTEIHPAGRVAALSPTVPMKRAGTAAETAAAILWLLSDDASYVTGAVLDVTGGR